MAVKYTGFYNIADSDYFRVLDAVFNIAIFAVS